MADLNHDKSGIRDQEPDAVEEKLTDADMVDLSDQERALLKPDEVEGADAGDAKAVEGADAAADAKAPEGDADAKPADDAASDEDGAKAAADGAGDTADDKAGDDKPAEAAVEPAAIDAGPPEIVTGPNDDEVQKWINVDFQQEINNLDPKRAKIDKDHEDGELSDAKWMDQREKLMEQSANLRQMSQNVSLYLARQDDQDKLFEDARAAFFDDQANEKYSTPMIKPAFREQLNATILSPEARGKSYRWSFEKAKQAVDSGLLSLGIGVPVAAATPKGVVLDPAQDPEKKPNRAPQQAEALAKASKTLSALPPADNEAADSEFDRMDAMNIEDLEMTLARMSENKRTKYEAMGA